MPSPFVSVICFREKGVIFFPLEPKKQKKKKKKNNNNNNNAWSQVSIGIVKEYPGGGGGGEDNIKIATCDLWPATCDLRPVPAD